MIGPSSMSVSVSLSDSDSDSTRKNRAVAAAVVTVTVTVTVATCAATEGHAARAGSESALAFSYVAMPERQQQAGATEIKKQKGECKGSLDSPVDLDPHTAVSLVKDLLKLSEAESKKLLAELIKTSEDPLLALKINPAWVAYHGAGADTAVLDEIADFEVGNGDRRDEQSPGFLYYFKTAHELDRCRAAVLGNHPAAFALSPDVLARIAPAAAALIPAPDREPLAFTAVIHKVGVRQDDVQRFQFFYFD